MYPDPRVLYDLGILVPGEDSETVYQEWLRSWEDFAPPTQVPRQAPFGGVKLWIVVRLLGKDLADIIEYDEQKKMLVPAKGFGELWGVATSPGQLAALLNPNQGQDPRDWSDDYVPQAATYAFLVFKARVRTEDQWSGLLDFFFQSGMLEPEEAQ
jgi:hypothetical protein